MSDITPSLVLRCKHCPERPPADSTVEALMLHMNVEHDTDRIDLDMIAVCTCGAEMKFVETTRHGARSRDDFRCEACGNTGSVIRGH